jgi:hypothetical protein
LSSAPEGFATHSTEIGRIRFNCRFRRHKSLIPNGSSERKRPNAFQEANAWQSRPGGTAGKKEKRGRI